MQNIQHKSLVVNQDCHANKSLMYVNGHCIGIKVQKYCKYRCVKSS